MNSIYDSLSVIVDKNNNLYILLLYIISANFQVSEKIAKSKNTLIGVSAVKSKKLDIARMILFIFSKMCSVSLKKHSGLLCVDFEEYIYLINRHHNNLQGQRKVVKALAELQITFCDQNREIHTEYLFKTIKLFYDRKAKKSFIGFEINSFFQRKLSARGKDHVRIEYPICVFRDREYRAYSDNCLRFICLMNMFTSPDDFIIDDDNLVYSLFPNARNKKDKLDVIDRAIEEGFLLLKRFSD